MKQKTYTIVFFWLVVLTLMELGVAAAPFSRELMVTLLLATAAGKAFLIALYFMHLKSENPLVWLLPGIPLFFAAYLLAGLLPDIAWHLTGNFHP